MFGMNEVLCALIFHEALRSRDLPLSSTLSSVLQNFFLRSTVEKNISCEIMSLLPRRIPSTVTKSCWKSNSGKFTLQSFFLLLQSPHALMFLAKGCFTKIQKIPRHGFILWLAILEKLSTMDQPWVPRSENGCVLCGGQFSESHDHLFFKCWFSKRCLTILNHKVRFSMALLGMEERHFVGEQTISRHSYS
ncbi:UNVERIFIED_CONTAM: hypothetical protein Sangu_3214300 [Sesamum angustifolium]|uniref:Reverse transcriptase zinc-binding domain-containing protein n=1 Tax=Sesamum angustifolium TaxID=2727405 RepID=A0AAW2JJV9_9LAMI